MKLNRVQHPPRTASGGHSLRKNNNVEGGLSCRKDGKTQYGSTNINTA